MDSRNERSSPDRGGSRGSPLERSPSQPRNAGPFGAAAGARHRGRPDRRRRPCGRDRRARRRRADRAHQPPPHSWLGRARRTLRSGDPRPARRDLAVRGPSGPEVVAYDWGDEIADGVVAHEVGAICPDDGALHITGDPGTLALADSVMADETGLGFAPDWLMDDPDTVRRSLVALRRLLDPQLRRAPHGSRSAAARRRAGGVGGLRRGAAIDRVLSGQRRPLASPG